MRVNQYYTAGTATAADALDNTAFGAVDVRGYEGIIFKNTTANCSVQISIDGTNYEAIDVYFEDLGAIDATAEERVLANGTTGATGPFLLKTPCHSIRFLNQGAAACTVRYGLVSNIWGR